jgi:hypothetical protein
MESKPGLCTAPSLKHAADIIIITMFTHCKKCDRYIEVREAISIHEINQFREGGKELRALKMEKLYEKFSAMINVGSE